jgi:hypothetical protein
MQPTTTMGTTMRAASRNGFGPGIGPRISINTITPKYELVELDIVSFAHMRCPCLVGHPLAELLVPRTREEGNLRTPSRVMGWGLGRLSRILAASNISPQSNTANH